MTARRTLLDHQVRWVQDLTPVKVIRKCRRSGISWCEAYWAVTYTVDDKGDVYYQSFALDITIGFIADCAEWATYIHDVASAVASEGVFDDIDADGKTRQIKTYELKITAQSGRTRRIIGLSSAPRQFRSKGRPGDAAILDEAAFVNNLEEVLKSVMAFRIWGGVIHVISTHNGEANPFNRLCRDIEKGVQPGSLHTVTFDDALDAGLAERVLEVSGEAITPEAIAAYIEDVRRTYRHNAAEELDCIPSSGSGAWLSWGDIRACQSDDAGMPENWQGNPGYLAVDVARRKHLWVCVALEPVGDVLWVREISILKNQPFSLQRAEVRRMRRAYRAERIGVDQTGMGENFYEDLVEEHGAYRVVGYLFGPAIKHSLATSLLECMEDRKLRIPPDDDLEADLHSIKRAATTGAVPRLVSDGAETDGHADRFWALAIGCAVADLGIGAFEGAANDQRSVGSTLSDRPEVDADKGMVLSAVQMELDSYGG